MLHFYKMQGLGNDYVYINCFETTVENPEQLATRISDRRFGIGSDGLILICPSDVADLQMRMFNADGSEGKMCGNGIRCVGKLAFEKGIVKTDKLTVETLSGIRTLKLFINEGKVNSVQVDMGAPSLEAEKVPVITTQLRLLNAPITVGGKDYNITCVSMGNPHAVIFTTGIDELNLEQIGPLFENNEIFPDRVNTEFVEIIDPHNLRMRVWERGSGETMACGTGACAVVVAACVNGISPRNEDINVHLRGGTLKIIWENDKVSMTGAAVLVFEGEFKV
jgi:diaminopimelate epimerase